MQHLQKNVFFPRLPVGIPHGLQGSKIAFLTVSILMLKFFNIMEDCNREPTSPPPKFLRLFRAGQQSKRQ
jgi:hypothetical protein